MSGDDQKYNFVQLPRFLSWRLLVPSLAVYGGIYAYERLTWTERSKEQAIKSQVINYTCMYSYYTNSCKCCLFSALLLRRISGWLAEVKSWCV